MAYQEANLEYLEDFSSGNYEIVKEIISLFLTQTPQDLKSLEDYLNSQNWDSAKSMAHHIKPTLFYVGAEDLRNQLQFIESHILDENERFDIVNSFPIIKNRFEVLFRELKDYMSQLPN